MKFYIVIESNMMDLLSAKELIGTSCGGTYFGELQISKTISDEQKYIFCCTGSYLQYLQNKRFWGRNRVFHF